MGLFREIFGEGLLNLPEDYSEKMNKKYLFAFLDHLGFSNKVLNASVDDNEWVSFVADTGIMIEDGLESNLKKISVDLKSGIEWKFFSDSLCIYCEIGNYETGEMLYNEEQLKQILEFFLYVVGYMQLSASVHNVLYRGGVSVGRFYDKDNVTVSDALVRAHDIEASVKVPAVGVDEMVWELFQDNRVKGELIEKGYLKQEEMLLVDYINLINPRINERAYKLRGMFFDNVEKTIVENWRITKLEIAKMSDKDIKKIKSIIGKYIWLANYYVEKCMEYGVDAKKIENMLNEEIKPAYPQ